MKLALKIAIGIVSAASLVGIAALGHSERRYRQTDEALIALRRSRTSSYNSDAPQGPGDHEGVFDDSKLYGLHWLSPSEVDAHTEGMSDAARSFFLLRHTLLGTRFM